MAKYANFDAFKKAYLGKAVDYDNTAGVQCVDLVDQYLKDCFDITGIWVTGARDLYNKFNSYTALTKKFKRIANTRDLVIKKGDIIVWGGGSWGHTGIGTGNGNIDWFESLEENTLGRHEPTQLVKHYFNGTGGNDGCNPVLGVLRPITESKKEDTKKEDSKKEDFKKKETSTKTKTITKMVIDISEFQPSINYAKLASEVDGVIVRIGYRGYGSAGTLVKDNKFDTHMNGIKKHKIPYGFYFFSQAKNEAEGKAEADYAYKIIKDYDPTYPVYFDSEGSTEPNGNGRADKISKSDRTAAALRFCKEIVKKGLTAGVYASTSWYNNKLDVSKLQKYSIWVADYGINNGRANTKPSITGMNAWQFTSKYKLSAISTGVDMSYFYETIPSGGLHPIDPTPKKEIKYTTYYANDKTGVNYRKTPNGILVGTYKYGAAVTVVNGSATAKAGYTWLKTKSGYWVAKELLSKTKPSTVSIAKYTKGKSYTLQVDLKVRTGAGTSYAQKNRKDLSASDKKNSYNQTKAVLKKGTKITATEVKAIDSKNVWIKCSAGWLNAINNGTIYIK